MPPHDEDNPDLPPDLVARLRALDDRRPFVPPAVDERVLDDAAPLLAGLRRAHRRRVVAWRIGPAAAAAAVLAMALWVADPFDAASPADRMAAAGDPADVDRSGRVDVLDALLLAQRIGTDRGGVDLDGDGVVDQRDVDLIAMRAVSLGEGGAG